MLLMSCECKGPHFCFGLSQFKHVLQFLMAVSRLARHALETQRWALVTFSIK